MTIVSDPIVPDSYHRTVIDYHLTQLALGHDAAERLYRKRISALTGWIFRKRKPHCTERFVDMCLSLACDEGEKIAQELFAKNPSLLSCDEWGMG